MPQPVVLQNEWIRAVVAPGEGGRIASLSCLRSGVEFLFQPLHPFRLAQPGRYAAFEQGACAGIEECLPTVAACTVDGEIIPDHGDFWQLPWDVLPSHSPDTLHLRANGFSRPLRFTKKIFLQDSCLRLEYQVENASSTSTSFHYATHPLLAIDPGDRMLLPEEISELTLHSSKDGRLGSTGDRVTWPLAARSSAELPIDLSLITEPTAATAEMLYSGKLRAGRCGLYRAQHSQGITVSFDTQQLPYLGLWICCAGWPEDGSGPRQYAFAPEPTTAPCGSLAEAQHQGLATSLPPSGSFRFAIEFCITEPGIALEELSRRIADSATLA